jgi:hypothetical protein
MDIQRELSLATNIELLWSSGFLAIKLFTISQVYYLPIFPFCIFPFYI